MRVVFTFKIYKLHFKHYSFAAKIESAMIWEGTAMASRCIMLMLRE